LSLPHRIIHKASYASIFIGMDESGEAEVTGESSLALEPASTSPTVRDFDDTLGEVDEDKCGGDH
jgi:hypothetical protein